ncbi:alpha/beta hydrolase domain-containing protein [Mycolicibacterium grossiae]|uniref:Alpha/beta hydrolase domain-containing protein n=1 Tax=Mycolicibacterium grossiae TaxID=1552759 RepID=A0A1E8PYY1_9MYCO|nr:alpha/beta hydrolase domain-containing protein [Mycolicibacterium grossiae]OFJ50949.1 hypothetical protein BEL07_25385 [Mycolicibacterium grossiae]QEM45127.1 hypothetical protein FZ046_10405 [Mycolicibacterium grossiae]
MAPDLTPVDGPPNLLLGAYDVADLDYTVREYFVSGRATRYVPSPDGVSADRVAPDGAADYTTRIVVLTPNEGFSGTVVVEWLNVSGGLDAPAVWFMAHREVVRARHAYVAVSAQRVGIEGGASLGMDMSLKTQSPQRYSDLHHPGDAYAYDVFTQVGRLLTERPGDVLDGLAPQAVLAVGESQSALFLTTYVNRIDRLAGVYDGFLVHSRFGPAAPLDGSSIFADTVSTDPVPFIDDLRVPVLTVITETDLVGGVRAGYHAARRPDDARLRTWEVPGTAHADNYTIGVGFIDSGAAPLTDLVAAWRPTRSLMGRELPHYVNFAPQHHYVLQAALAALAHWVRTGEPATTAAPMDLTDADPPQLLLDRHGLATGGVRTPWVDVPVARTSGLAPGDDVMALLFGSGEPFDAATVRELYPCGLDDYVERFTAALDAAIDAGVLLAADRAEIVDLATATYPMV